MFAYFFMALAGLASLTLPVLGVIALVTYIRRGRPLQGQDMNDPSRAAVLDSLDQVHLRLDALNDRLARLERSLEAGDRSSLPAPETEEADRARTGGEGPDEAGSR
jgi:hypothetical protein